ncbi:hypothetical protein VTK26DRAFT_7341 [Humicola hyalothermophila]
MLRHSNEGPSRSANRTGPAPCGCSKWKDAVCPTSTRVKCAQGAAIGWFLADFDALFSRRDCGSNDQIIGFWFPTDWVWAVAELAPCSITSAALCSLDWSGFECRRGTPAGESDMCYESRVPGRYAARRNERWPAGLILLVVDRGLACRSCTLVTTSCAG